MPHKQVVKALYDYDANASGELTIKEDELLYSYDTDEGWTLVRNQKGGTVGYVPGNYIEEACSLVTSTVELLIPLKLDENGAAASPPPSSSSVSKSIVSTITIAQSAQPPQSPVTQPVAPISSPSPQHILTGEKGKADDIQTWSLSELDKKGKKKKGTLGVGGGAVFFASETDKVIGTFAVFSECALLISFRRLLFGSGPSVMSTLSRLRKASMLWWKLGVQKPPSFGSMLDLKTPLKLF